jgi:urease accessory protein
MTTKPFGERSIAVAATLLAACSVHAHPGHDVESLGTGLAHPLLGADHLLAMVAVGVWSAAAFRGPRAAVGPLVFLGTLICGALLAMSGVAVPRVEAGVAASVVVLAALLFLGRRTGVGVGLCAIAFAGLLHGYAHGSELGAGRSALAYCAGFMLTSAALHLAGLGLGVRMRGLPTRAWNVAATLLGTGGLWMLASRL